MEFVPPWPPTPLATRRLAVETYCEGERLCDAGDHAAGIPLLRKAGRLAWELEGEAWPQWAEAMRASPPLPPPPPPLLDRSTRSWPTELTYLHAAAGDVWWRHATARHAIASALTRHGTVLLDDFAAERMAAARAECERAALRPARLRAEGGGLVVPEAAVRGDQIAWVGGEAQWQAVRAVARLVDELVCSVRLELGGAAARIRSRMAPMVARYASGAAFARHADNHCLRGEGKFCDSRVLTAVLYLSSDDWDASAHGGCLRLYRPAAGAEGEQPFDSEANAAADDDDVLMDVAPIADRLCLFFADLRCPHEVLPVTREDGMRAACTVWYCEGDESSFPLPLEVEPTAGGEEVRD
ncbi:hypothetical protein AB1Y20_011959 [Prymnesium parvum]|uniref:Fe2OG dioxygenase domain-containing protein n=1 Tax=Prymnesium parvum TaxID=97485 RepID=A0AB34INE1_PRYPA